MKKSKKSGEINAIWKTIKKRRTRLIGHNLRHGSVVKILIGMIVGKNTGVGHAPIHTKSNK